MVNVVRSSRFLSTVCRAVVLVDANVRAAWWDSLPTMSAVTSRGRPRRSTLLLLLSVHAPGAVGTPVVGSILWAWIAGLGLHRAHLRIRLDRCNETMAQIEQALPGSV